MQNETDRWTNMTKLIVAFHYFVDAPKNYFSRSLVIC